MPQPDQALRELGLEIGAEQEMETSVTAEPSSLA